MPRRAKIDPPKYLKSITIPFSRENIFVKYLLLLLLTAALGCRTDAATDSASTPGEDTQNQAETAVKKDQGFTDGTPSDAQIAELLAQYLGQWEGTAIHKGADGKVQAQFPITNSCRWLEEGKSIEIRLTEKLPQGDQQLIFTKWYDRKQQRFLVTRRMAGDEVIPKPGAYETYDPATGIFHGIVTEGLAAGDSWTWTSQVADKNDLSADGTLWVYTGTLKQEGIVQTTRIDTLSLVNPEADTP